MSENQSAKAHKKRQKKKQDSTPSIDESIIDQADTPMEDPEFSEGDKDNSESFKEMSEEEMTQHLKLCMKLSAENKINTKNAFGLRLIEILQKMVNKSEKADIQQASLSLQASSKVYAGRVEALYQDTMKFHSHLQSIVSGGKKDKKRNVEEEMDDGFDDDDATDRNKGRNHKSKCKNFLKAEESLNMDQDVSSLSTGEPHGNFQTINAAFSTSRLAPKLLSSLQLSNDSCALRCVVAEPCFKPKNAMKNEVFQIPQKLEGMLEKIKIINIERTNLESLTESSGALASPYMSTPKPVAPPAFFDDDDNDDGFAAPEIPDDIPLMTGPTDDANSVESAIEKLDVLNITANVFVNDISAAVTDQGIDHRLLPPNSVLKKMLDRSKRSSIKPSVGKSTKRKTKEPFFAGKSADGIKHFFAKGRTTTVSQKILSEWNVENTSNIDLGYEFIQELELKKESCFNTELDQVLDVLKQNDPQYHFKYYFNKMSQVWKFSRRKLCQSESFADIPNGNQTEKRVGSLAPTDPEALALSFQNLSIHDSIVESPDFAENMSDNEVPGIIDTEEQQFVLPPEPFETDIEDIMVKPPELVRPTIMKFDKRPVNLNTEKIKNLLKHIITKHIESKSSSNESGQSYALFSEVYEELKIKLEKEISEFISMQFAFVVLLILANEKTLLIENVKENTDLSIKQDLCEIEVADNI